MSFLPADEINPAIGADDVAPHSPWQAHAHADRSPCYCWHRGPTDGTKHKRWLLYHADGRGWGLYDRRRLDAGELGPVAGPWRMSRSDAAQLADIYIDEQERFE